MRDTTSNTKARKKNKLRNNEYYNMQDTLDKLYEKSKEEKPQNKLLEIIISKENIILAYRNIKRNKGSSTKGTNNHTIKHLEKMTKEQMVGYVRHRLSNYAPEKVRRVEIPKPNGKTRPLGIPTIEDRLIQQCILQVLEPICEAKFHPHSYGFRPNRSTKHAIARSQHLINHGKNYYVVDIDIKGFFDNVNHAKLTKQLWSIGIQDKNLLCIIGKMLKAEVDRIGIPTKGTPQGGILSPLLANVVLDELDWWIHSQWEGMKTKHGYSSTENKHRALKKTNLKEMFIVRYADDFKIFCKTKKHANKIFIAVKNWLKERLDLEISPDKSHVTNLKKRNSEFLGFTLKAVYNPKLKKHTCQSHMSEKARNNAQAKIQVRIKEIQKFPTAKSVRKYNATVLGLHNYYNIASQVTIDFSQINYTIQKTLYNRLQSSSSIVQPNEGYSKTYLKYYGDYKTNIRQIQGTAMFPVHGIKTKNPLCFTQETCSYTEEGRKIIHKNLDNISTKMLVELLQTTEGESIEYIDNRISLYVAQKGKCAITGVPLTKDTLHCHHLKPKSKGGTDVYKNLKNIRSDVHRLIHATQSGTIDRITETIQKEMPLDEKMMEKINKYRKLVGNTKIIMKTKAN